MTRLVVDATRHIVSNVRNDVLITHELGSCIAVILHDPVLLVGGMVHYTLPASPTTPEADDTILPVFTNSSVPSLFQSMYALGCKRWNLVVKLAGGGRLHDDVGTFDIGRRNVTSLRQMLRKANVLIAAEDVGGAKSRIVALNIGTGHCFVRAKNDSYLL